MSRETLLDDAITKAKEAEDWQLVEWLRMTRDGESAARWYTAKLNEARLDISKLMTDNAKLRELAAGIGHLLFVLDVDYCAICPRDDINHPCPVHTVKGGECLYEADLRELGVEVTE